MLLIFLQETTPNTSKNLLYTLHLFTHENCLWVCLNVIKIQIQDASMVRSQKKYNYANGSKSEYF